MTFLESYKAYLKDNPKGYWFKAKLYGWGWTPVKWQGWAVILLFILAVLGNSYRLGFDKNRELPIEYLVELVLLVLLLIVICAIKGERPHWQWGLKKDTNKKDR